MNRKLGIQNFRVFDEKGAQFKLAPITVLTGCNSSGKSSVIKAMMLFKSFLKDFAGDYHSKNMKPIPSYTLELNQGEHKLARFDKSLNKGSKSDEMVFSWSKHSIFANKEIKVEYVFKENTKNKLGNGYLHQIRIIAEGKCIYRLRYDMDENEQTYEIDHQAFRNMFFDFSDTLSNGDTFSVDFASTDAFFKNKQHDIFEVIKTLNGAIKSKRFNSAYLYLKNGTNSQLEKLIKFLESLNTTDLKNKTLFFSPGYEYLKDATKENINTLLFGLIESQCVKDTSFHHYESLIDSFIDSKHVYFKDYFAEMEVSYMSKMYNETFEFTDSFFKDFEMNSKSFISRTVDYLKSLSSTSDCSFNLSFLNFPNKHDEFEKVCFILFAFSEYVEIGYRRENNTTSKGHVKKADSNIEKKPQNHEVYTIQKKFNTWLEFIELFLEDVIFNLPEFLDNVEFINSSRPKVERSYDLSNIGTFNSLLKDYVSYNERRIIYDYKKNDEIGFVEQFYKLGIFVRKWVKELEIADDIIFEPAEDGPGIYIYLVNNEERVLLADLGYGVTQVLSMLLKIELSIIDSFEEGKSTDTIIDGDHTADTQSNRGTTIVIEEPEANLHPKLQSKLADMFMEANEKHNINFILETHSEYLIRKFQTLVADPEHSAKSQDIAIYYLYHPDNVPAGKKQVEDLEMRPDGFLKKDFGEGFFDEASNLTFKLLKFQSLN